MIFHEQQNEDCDLVLNVFIITCGFSKISFIPLTTSSRNFPLSAALNRDLLMETICTKQDITTDTRVTGRLYIKKIVINNMNIGSYQSTEYLFNSSTDCFNPIAIH